MNIPLRALIIEDSEVDCQLLKNHLERGGYEVTSERVETAEAMNAALDRGGWDIIISDHRMPHFSSLAALKLYKERGCDLPFIVVSGSIGEELAVTAMRAGAHDYIMKDNLARLVLAVARELGEAETRRQCRRAEQALEHSHHRTELILEAAGEGICGLNAGGVITFINSCGAELIGWKQHELIGQSLHAVVHHVWDDQIPVPRQDCSLCALLGDGLSHGMDGEIFWRKDRTAFPIEYVCTPLRDGEGNMGAVLTFRDITEHKGVEAALLDTNCGLERIVMKLRQRQLPIVPEGEDSPYDETQAGDEQEPAAATSSSLVIH